MGTNHRPLTHFWQQKYLLRSLPLLFLLALTLYGVIVEPMSIRLAKVVVRNPALAKVLHGQQAVLISDLHLDGSEPDRRASLLQTIQNLKPDIIFLTGDYVAWHGDQQAYTAANDFLQQLRAPLGVYGVLGDADYIVSRQTCQFCHESTADYSHQRTAPRFLENSSIRLTSAYGDLTIFGFDTQSGDEAEQAARIETFARTSPVIVLTHTSRIYNNLAPTSNALVLSGDTHGGQIRLPSFLWRILKYKPNPEHMHGLFTNGHKNLYVTSGLGTSFPHLRVGVPPEIVLLEFQP